MWGPGARTKNETKYLTWSKFDSNLLRGHPHVILQFRVPRDVRLRLGVVDVGTLLIFMVVHRVAFLVAKLGLCVPIFENVAP